MSSVRATACAVVLAMSCSSPPNDTHRADDWASERRRMVVDQLSARDIGDARVLDAMARVARHAFVPRALQNEAYADRPLPIGSGQTISQPYVVALMTQLLGLRGDEVVLEIGTGSGYQAAVLSRLAQRVYSIEIDADLARSAAERLASLGYGNVQVRNGDGFLGWPQAAPFDAIIVTAATPRIPQPLVAQLREGGRLVAPVGRDGGQQLVRGVKTGGTLKTEPVTDVLFVPMTGLVETPGP